MRTVFICILLVLPAFSFAQNRFLYLKVDSLVYYLGGGHSRRAFAELGVASAQKNIGKKSKLITSVNFEFHFQKPFLAAARSKFVLTNIIGPIGAGANVVQYGLFAKDGSLALAPEVGIGLGRIRAFCNYNFFVTHPGFNQVSRNVFGLNLWLGKAKV